MVLVALIGIGLIGGYLSGLLGIGGGVIFVPALVFFLGLPIHQAIGVSLAVVIPTALTGLTRHYITGVIDFRIMLPIILCSALGAWFGASTAAHLPAATVRRIFGVFLIIIGLNAIFDWSGKPRTASALDAEPTP